MSVADLAEEEDLQLTATVPPELAGNRLDAACARLRAHPAVKWTL